MAMLSIPVWGVESRNEVAAARLAPWRRKDAVTGITPHEHSTSGTPKSVAFHTGRNPRPPKCRSTNSGEMHTESTPAARKPNNRYGAIWPSTDQLSRTTLIRSSLIVTDDRRPSVSHFLLAL